MSRSLVVSADGTPLAYRELGVGPGVVLLHGAMQTAQNFSRLAEALSRSFRVYVPDRRGRGRSGPFGPEYGLAREAEDLEALLRQTGARFVFGLSSGALIALYAARSHSSIAKLALYEPPLTVEGADPAAWVSRYERELDRGALASAMVTVIQGTGDVGLFGHLPRLLLVPLMRLAIRADAARAGHGAERALRSATSFPTARFDAQLQREATGLLPTLADVPCDVLLMSGDRSHRALRAGIDQLTRWMPRAKLARLAKIGHLAADDGGRPREVAGDVLRSFFDARR